MEKLIISKIEGSLYTFKNKATKKEHKFKIKFFDVAEEILEGSPIVIHENLLDPNYEEYSNELYFGPLDAIYGRSDENLKPEDIIAISIDNKIIKLKRFFG